MLNVGSNNMIRAFLLCLVGIGLVVLTAPNADACWLSVPLDKLVKRSPVIIIGTIDSIKIAVPPIKKYYFLYDTAYITVSDMLKNTLLDFKIVIGNKIPLSLPSESDNMSASTDIYYAKGTTGIWILEYRDNTFWATYPDDLQPKSEEQQVRDIIEKLKKESFNIE